MWASAPVRGAAPAWPRSKWSAPHIPGHSCRSTDWLLLYAQLLFSSGLVTDLHELEGLTLVCDCPMSQPCEADVLAGLLFDTTSSSSKKAVRRATRVPPGWRQPLGVFGRGTASGIDHALVARERCGLLFQVLRRAPLRRLRLSHGRGLG